MARYRLAELARNDLAEIHRYIATDSVSAADRLLTRLFHTFGVLATHPELGTTRREYKGGNLRSFAVDNYVIFYRLAGTTIDVARVLHGARDIDSLMG